jgi:hypothetical protein
MRCEEAAACDVQEFVDVGEADRDMAARIQVDERTAGPLLCGTDIREVNPVAPAGTRAELQES